MPLIFHVVCKLIVSWLFVILSSLFKRYRKHAGDEEMKIE